MARNKKLELEYQSSGKWKTADGRFAIVKRAVADEPWKVTENWKIKYEYSIHDLREYGGPMEFPEFAREIGRVQRQTDVFPWLGKYTGEGSFELGNPDLTKPRTGGNGVSESGDPGELAVMLGSVFGEELLAKREHRVANRSILNLVFGDSDVS